MGLPRGGMKGRSHSGSGLASVSITSLHGLMSGRYMGERMAEVVRTAKFCAVQVAVLWSPLAERGTEGERFCPTFPCWGAALLLGERFWPHRGARGSQWYPADVAGSGGHSPR